MGDKLMEVMGYGLWEEEDVGAVGAVRIVGPGHLLSYGPLPITRFTFLNTLGVMWYVDKN